MAPQSLTSQTSKCSCHSAATQAASSPTKSTPKPCVCQRCDGHPLIKDCEVHKVKPRCSKKLVAKLAVAQAMNNIGLPPPQILEGSPTNNFTTGMHSDPPAPQGSTGPHPSDVFNEDNLDPILRRPQRVSVPNSDPFVEIPQPKSKPPSVRFPIAGIGSPTVTSQLLRFDNNEEEDVHSYLPLTSPGIPGLTLSSQPSYMSGSSSGCIRPTMANPFHGMVFGAMRGTQPHAIPRPRELRPPMQSTSLATEHFCTQCLDIISRVEWLNVETGGWLFFMGQHGNATSTNTFFHYASDKLHKEASDATNGLINEFGDIVDGLILLNKKEAMNLNKQYADSERHCQWAVQDAQLAFQADLMFDLLQKLQSGALESHKIPNLNTMHPSSNHT
ncbi:hypothetical protein DXG01_000625 [Tephrocybe rancida]|nr:hypothetical protein DXG01_000625 [Tephrocybe rancida]